MKPKNCHRIAMVLQGGGALGAYQAGVYQALHESQLEPDWVSGVSIGAINSAIIAGNNIADRLTKLKEFWHEMSESGFQWHGSCNDEKRKWLNIYHSFKAMMVGQPGFFTPRNINPWMNFGSLEERTSFYDTTPIKNTIQKYVDFDILNSKKVEFAIGAVNVESGNFVYFDNTKEKIRVEHILASGALPPAFPMVKIDNDYYWDGGIVSNTPLKHLLNNEGEKNSLVFQVDLFSAVGMLPEEMCEVMERQKDIMYSSRTRANTDLFRRVRRWKKIAFDAISCIPENQRTIEQKLLYEDLKKTPDTVICQLVYMPKTYEGESKDYDFSYISMKDHWKSGYEDTIKVISNPENICMPESGTGIVIHNPI